MKHLKILFAFFCCCVSYSTKAQREVSVINLAKAWSDKAEILNLSSMTDAACYNIIEQEKLYGSIGNIKTGNGYVLFKQTLHYGKELSDTHIYNNGEFIDNGVIDNNDNILYYQVSNSNIEFFDTNGNITKSVKLPDWVNRVCPISQNELMAYRTKNTEITDNGLAEFCIIDLNTNKTVFTHFSLSKEEAAKNKLWFPLMNNKAWTYCGKVYFYENISNNIYEIVKNTDNKFSLEKRFKMEMSPLSIDYPQTVSISPNNYKMGISLHISDIKEMSKCIVFNMVLNKERKKLVLLKDGNKVINVLKINPDIDGITNGEDVIPYSALDKQQQEVLMQEKHIRQKDVTKNIFILPVYQ